MIGSNEMIRCGLGSRVRAAGRISSGLGERWRIRGEGSVNLVRGDMQEAKGRTNIRSHVLPIPLSLLQKREGAIDVRANEFPGTGNRTIDVAFRSKMDYARRLKPLEQLPDKASIIDVALHKVVALCIAKVVKIARIGELIEVYDQALLSCVPMQDN